MLGLKLNHVSKRGPRYYLDYTSTLGMFHHYVRDKDSSYFHIAGNLK